MDLTEALRDILRENGAMLVGVGDMRDVEGCAYPTGVAVAVALPKSIVRTIPDAPTREYLDIYPRLNAVLNASVTAGETP